MNKFRLVLQSTEKNLYESEVNSVSLGSKGGDTSFLDMLA